MSQLKTPNLVSLTSVNEDGSRYFLHPADVSGRFTTWRRIFGIALLAIYVLLPWIPVNGAPAVLLDLPERRFHFFGLTFLAEDLWIGFFLLTGLGFSLFYVTSLFGRLWCGWACPYTVFLEHLYRRIERLVDGDATKRRALDAAPWTRTKVVKRLTKHGLYLVVSLLIAHVFISYFVPLPRLFDYMRQSPAGHFQVFGIMLFLTGALQFSFAWFREQFCIILCPYGRIQSALTDDDTVIIGYDAKRGEPRGKASDPSAGACIGCNRCVQVCPTGIDIRNGLQLECIGCAACVDACDDIMTKIGRPKGLVRYDSLNGLAGGKKRFVRPRTILYTGFMFLGLTVLGLFLTRLHSAKIELIRMPGQPYYVDENGVRNHYKLQFITKRQEPTEFIARVEGLPEGCVIAGLDASLTLQPGEETMRTLIITIPKALYQGDCLLRVIAEVKPGDLVLEDTIEFLGPSPYSLKN